MFEDDGGFLMHVQELETVRRHWLKLLFVVFNDGTCGSEIHNLRADGIDDGGSVFGRTDLSAVAKGFDLRGANVTDVSRFRPQFDAYREEDVAEVWNVHISDKVANPSMRRQVIRGHGKM